jgi:hypothetical protein
MFHIVVPQRTWRLISKRKLLLSFEIGKIQKSFVYLLYMKILKDSLKQLIFFLAPSLVCVQDNSIVERHPHSVLKIISETKACYYAA